MAPTEEEMKLLLGLTTKIKKPVFELILISWLGYPDFRVFGFSV